MVNVNGQHCNLAESIVFIVHLSIIITITIIAAIGFKLRKKRKRKKILLVLRFAVINMMSLSFVLQLVES